jgi:hypothetical protein
MKYPVDLEMIQAIRSRGRRKVVLRLDHGDELELGSKVTFCESDGMPLAPGCKPGGHAVTVIVARIKDQGVFGGQRMRLISWD